MSRHSFLYYCSSLTGLLLLAGCSSAPYMATLHTLPIPQGTIGEFKAVNTYSIKNIQSDKESKEILNYNWYAYAANQHLWTYRAIELLGEELRKRGGRIAVNGDKELKLALTVDKYVHGTWMSRCYVTLKVELGNGDKHEFSVDNGGGGQGRVPDTIGRACGGAVAMAVGEVLNDKSVIDYLK